MRSHLLLAVVVLMLSSGCGGTSTPISPSTPPLTALTWSLTGAVTSVVGGGINAATVAILDGPDAGKQATADASGRYSFIGLQQAGFTLRASANGYSAVSKAVTLTANTVTDFQLPRLPVAALTFEGELGIDPRPDGAFDLHATAVNTGDGCASAIGGTTTLTGAITRSFTWALPTSTVVRPAERFQYAFGPISRADLTAFGASGTYVTRFTFTSTACP